jgi:hypothetical protein
VPERWKPSAPAFWLFRQAALGSWDAPVGKRLCSCFVHILAGACQGASITLAGQSGEERKQFFFEKKNQKTFAYWARACGQSQGMKVFCFFFSKKKTFLWLPAFTRLP